MYQPKPWLTLSPDAPIDLQMHTTNSDGSWTPEELVDYLAKEQFALAAITDHERVDTAAQVQRYAATRGVHILIAAEMSTHWHGQLADLLCYGFDPAHNTLGELAQRVRNREIQDAQNFLAVLQQQGYRFTKQQEVLENHGGQPKKCWRYPRIAAAT
ncbi:PHP domain-containing protein [Dictyobacter kobayashii]|uniref:Polymerase/histidinol phosphatase N-terminal domain-containing protein n=1 Tax=Dictyobacter kobayashii TaxID=2014872 RepID=A0A402AQR5_9CHLR|nr:PHP domain-containing protein [Dictyobacter kobayashii]GCE21441.1 hypothetical protein KDK_52410 [Dictyobacter kobayashii]